MQRRLERLEDFETVVLAQKARTAQSRAALSEQAGLDPEQLARFDAAVSRMNADLAGYGTEVMDLYMSEGMLRARQILAVGHEVSGRMLDAQQVLDELVGQTTPGDVEDTPQH